MYFTLEHFPPLRFHGLLFYRNRKVILLRRHRWSFPELDRMPYTDPWMAFGKSIIIFLQPTPPTPAGLDSSFLFYKPLSKSQISELFDKEPGPWPAGYKNSQENTGRTVHCLWKLSSLLSFYPGNYFLIYRVFSYAWKRSCQQNLYTPTLEQGSANYSP